MPPRLAADARDELAARLAASYVEPRLAIESWRGLRAELEAKGESGAYAD